MVGRERDGVRIRTWHQNGSGGKEWRVVGAGMRMWMMKRKGEQRSNMSS